MDCPYMDSSYSGYSHKDLYSGLNSLVPLENTQTAAMGIVYSLSTDNRLQAPVACIAPVEPVAY